MGSHQAEESDSSEKAPKQVNKSLSKGEVRKIDTAKLKSKKILTCVAEEKTIL